MAPLKMRYNGQALLAPPDDLTLTKNVDDTHKPDGRTFDVMPVMSVIEQIFSQAAPPVLTATSQAAAATEDKADHASIDLDALGGLSYTIHKIGCEITCKCSGGTDSHATTMELLSGALSVYSWERKLVLALAAFAMSYGEFSLTGRLCAVNPLAKSVAVLKRLPDAVEQDTLSPKFDALNNLIKAMLKTTRCIIGLGDLPLDDTSMDAPAMVTAQSYIPTAVYWIINSAVTSSAQVVGQTSMRHEYHASKSEGWELSSSGLVQKVNNIHDLLSKQLEICLQIIDEKKTVESLRTLAHLFLTNHADNMEIMREIFPSKDGCPFIQSSLDHKVNVETLRWKMVLLLFSDLQMIAEEEHLSFLIRFYEAFHSGLENAFEIVWVPLVVDSVDDPINQEKHETAILKVAAEMPWLTAHPPPHPKSVFVNYVRKEWKFEDKPILVALDGQGKVISPDALYMIKIWEDGAYPFSTAREEALWKTATWKLDFIIHGVHPELSSWVGEKQICLYGGEDIEWIRSFTSKMKEIAKAAGISMEMAYFGVPHPRAPTKKIIDTVTRERLSASCGSEAIGFFWTRLECMLNSLTQSRKWSELDRLQKEVITLLTYGDSGRGWAVFARTGDDVLVTDGKALLHTLDNFGSWKDEIAGKGFNGALQTGHDLLKSPDHCLRLALPNSSAVHHIACPQCRKNMKTYRLFQCCDAELVPDLAAAAAAAANTSAAAAGPATSVASGEKEVRSMKPWAIEPSVGSGLLER